MGKARTKAAKLKSKRGRPLLPATDRQPNGQPSRRRASIAQKEDMMREVAVVARARHLNITEAQALDPKRGYTLGNLHLDGKITLRQHEAGIMIGEAFARYIGLKGLPFPSARAQNLFSIRSNPGEDNEAKGNAARNAADKMQEIRNVLLAVGDINTGRKTLRAVESLCIEDVEQARGWPEPMMLLVRRGLNKAADHYGLPD